MRKEVLAHLGVRPGDRLEVSLVSGGRLQIRAKPGQPVSAIFGMLARQGTRARSIGELNEAAAAGWAGEE